MQTTAICWACTTLVSVPGDAAPAPVFKCGWCGAINELKHSQSPATVTPQPKSSPTPASSPNGGWFRTVTDQSHGLARHGGCLKLLHRCLTKLQGTVVAVLIIFILSYIMLGTLVLIPRAVSSQHIVLKVLSQLIAWVLAYNVVFNYAAAVMVSPGTVQECFRFPQQTSQISDSPITSESDSLSSNNSSRVGWDVGETRFGAKGMAAQIPADVLQNVAHEGQDPSDDGRALLNGAILYSKGHSHECQSLRQGSNTSLPVSHGNQNTEHTLSTSLPPQNSQHMNGQVPTISTTITILNATSGSSLSPSASMPPILSQSTSAASLQKSSAQSAAQPPNISSPTYHVNAATGSHPADPLLPANLSPSATHTQHPRKTDEPLRPLDDTFPNPVSSSLRGNPPTSNPHTQSTHPPLNFPCIASHPSGTSTQHNPANHMVKSASCESRLAHGSPDTLTHPTYRVPAGSYEGVRYCRPCNGPKPAEAHHCSSCRKCFVGLDHHCPFLNSCVARANQRNFICMLAWTIVAMSYGGTAAVGCCHATSSQEWLVMYNGWAAASRFLKLEGLLAFTIEILVQTPPHLLAVAYVIVSSLGVGTAVAALLIGQLRSLYRGTTYVDELLRRKVEGGVVVARLAQPRSMYDSLSHLFGRRNVWAWLIPVWGPAPGVVLRQHGKKLV